MLYLQVLTKQGKIVVEGVNVKVQFYAFFFLLEDGVWLTFAYPCLQ